jgi:hypothetical protein
MALGIILGNTVPSVGPALQRGEFVGVSIPIGELDSRLLFDAVQPGRCSVWQSTDLGSLFVTSLPRVSEPAIRQTRKCGFQHLLSTWCILAMLLANRMV